MLAIDVRLRVLRVAWNAPCDCAVMYYRNGGYPHRHVSRLRLKPSTRSKERATLRAALGCRPKLAANDTAARPSQCAA